MNAGEPTRCRFCGQPRRALDDHYATCPRLEACLPIRRTRVRTRVRAQPPAPKPPPGLGRAYSQARHCPTCGKWITDKARACKRHMTLVLRRGEPPCESNRQKGRGRAGAREMNKKPVRTRKTETASGQIPPLHVL